MLASGVSQLLQLGLLSTAVVAFPPFSGYGPGFHGHPGAKTVYLQTNDAANSLVAIPINPRDGTLSGGSVVSTNGGRGGNELNAPGKPVTPDALGSQGSVAVAGNLIFVVNAGSNSLSVFEAAFDLHGKPRLIETTGQLPGEFPITVAASLRHQIVCVGFGGAKSGTSCLPFSERGLGKAGPLHAFDLAQSTPPNNNISKLGQVFFSADEEHLYITARGPKAFFGSIPAAALLSTEPSAILFSLQDPTLVLFDGVSVPGSNIVAIADPNVGARYLSVNVATQQAVVEKTVNITGQKATCWIALDAETGHVFVDDAGQNRLLELDSHSGAIISELAYGGSATGGFDLVAVGGYVYILDADNGKGQGSITVISSTGKQGGLKYVQTFSLQGLADANAVGIAAGY